MLFKSAWNLIKTIREEAVKVAKAKSNSAKTSSLGRPALNPEERENQMIQDKCLNWLKGKEWMF